MVATLGLAWGAVELSDRYRRWKEAAEHQDIKDSIPIVKLVAVKPVAASDPLARRYSTTIELSVTKTSEAGPNSRPIDYRLTSPDGNPLAIEQILVTQNSIRLSVLQGYKPLKGPFTLSIWGQSKPIAEFSLPTLPTPLPASEVAVDAKSRYWIEIADRARTPVGILRCKGQLPADLSSCTVLRTNLLNSGLLYGGSISPNGENLLFIPNIQYADAAEIELFSQERSETAETVTFHDAVLENRYDVPTLVLTKDEKARSSLGHEIVLPKQADGPKQDGLPRRGAVLNVKMNPTDWEKEGANSGTIQLVRVDPPRIPIALIRIASDMGTVERGQYSQLFIRPIGLPTPPPSDDKISFGKISLALQIKMTHTKLVPKGKFNVRIDHSKYDAGRRAIKF